jgi:hypothetical protein
MCEQSVLTGFMPQSDKNVSRETVLSDWGRIPYKTTSIAQGETRAIARKLGLFGGWLVRLRARASVHADKTFIGNQSSKIQSGSRYSV